MCCFDGDIERADMEKKRADMERKKRGYGKKKWKDMERKRKEDIGRLPGRGEVGKIRTESGDHNFVFGESFGIA